MATEQSDKLSDPASAGNYDYMSDEVHRPGLVSDLKQRVDGEVRFDTYTRQLYATDASAYSKTPIGVVFPYHTDDVSRVMQYCAEREIPVLPRGGGTSLAGQTVNEAVVLDLSRHMQSVLSVNPATQTARAQAGVRLGDLNAELQSHGLKFAPDPAWGDKSVLGGAIGNNSTGAHSLKYGKTDYYLESVEVVLADGTVTTFGHISMEELREQSDQHGDLESRIYAAITRILETHADDIAEVYPDLKRNVSGYNLDMLVDDLRGKRRLPGNSGIDPDSEEGVVNLARLLAGSEGTLATVTEAEISLVEIPETKAVALLTYDDVIGAMRDVAPILEHDPAAVEVMDDTLLELARDTAEFSDVVGLLPEGTDAVLLIEFYATDEAHGRQQVADLVADRVPNADASVSPSSGADARTTTPQTAEDAMEAHDTETREKFWKMRKSGLPILLSRTSDKKHIAYIEDTAIPAENLPDYIADFQEILSNHDTFASYYAHAGPGVLHIRPLINTKSAAEVETFESIAESVTDLVVKYGGSISGEHGDGRARTQWNRKLYGDELFSAFRELKTAFDPDWLLNPGNICGDYDLTENLRFDPQYEFDTGFEPVMNWENDNGFAGMVELCHGCGGCRGTQEVTGGVMCPTYRAAEEEIQTTRGRANMLRRAFSGQLDNETVFTDEFVEEVLDLCIGCKGCAKDCPSGVDMAKMKAELTHEYHQRNGSSFRDRVFANITQLSKIGSALAPVSNVAQQLPGSGIIQEKLLGIARERTLPKFHRQTLRKWFHKRGGTHVSAENSSRKVILFPDIYSNHNHPTAGKAAVRTLEALRIHVEIPDEVAGSGRPPHSKGFLDKARSAAETNIELLNPYIEKGYDIVVIEPSDAVMFQRDYLDLLSGPAVERFADNSYGILEYIDTFNLLSTASISPTVDDEYPSLTYHGHCHQKSTKKDHHAVGVLRRAGYAVDPLDSTCCGMAGSFGYESEHYSMSQSIADILFEQIEQSSGEIVTAPGASCRSQLGGRAGQEAPPHPIEFVEESL